LAALAPVLLGFHMTHLTRMAVFSLSLTKTSNIYRYFAAGSEMCPFINKRK
jgi:hypothetical protein